MRTYKIFTEKGAEFTVHCDQLVFRDEFLRQTTQETLCLFREDKIVAMFKNWINVVDITRENIISEGALNDCV